MSDPLAIRVIVVDDPSVGRFTYIINTLGVTLGDGEDESGDPLPPDVIELYKGSGYFSNMAEVQRWTLAVSSNPLDGVEFSLDGSSQVTPHSDNLTQGDHAIVMPLTWTVGEDVYDFVEWEEGSMNPTRIVSLTTDTVITAYYELEVPLQY